MSNQKWHARVNKAYILWEDAVDDHEKFEEADDTAQEMLIVSRYLVRSGFFKSGKVNFHISKAVAMKWESRIGSRAVA